MIIKLPVGVWQREHAGGVTMVVIQLLDDAYDVHRHEGKVANPIPDNRRYTLEEAQKRADEFVLQEGHGCTARCGTWTKKA